MGECSASIPRERVLAVCEWAVARAAEIGREKDWASLRDEAARRNWWRRVFRMRPLGDAEVHGRLMMSDQRDYPWSWWWSREFDEMRTLALDAEGGVRVDGRAWRNMLRWCRDNGWQDDLDRNSNRKGARYER